MRPLLLLALALPAHAIFCGPGQFSNDTVNCYSCPANTYCQGGVVAPCPRYSVSPAGSSTIDQCVCQPNSAQNNGQCICNTGYVLDANFNCVLCPANSFCPDQNTVRPCSNNALSQPGQSSPMGCNACPAGYIQNSATNAPISCRPCTSGYACPTLSSETRCAAGTYAPTFATACVQCGANSYAGDAATACIPCAAHATAPNGSQSIYACNCDAGYYRDSFFRCNLCPPGVACASNMALQCGPGTWSAGGQAQCTPCALGTYQDASSATVCKTCPAGVTILQTAAQSDTQSILNRNGLDVATNRMYISLNELINARGNNVTSWQFYATQTGCAVTPLIFQGSGFLGQPGITFQIVRTGTKRVTTSSGPQSFPFSDTDAPYLVPTPPTIVPVDQQYVSTYFGFVFDGPTCIPNQPTSSPGQAFYMYGVDGYSPALTLYSFPGIYPAAALWSFSVGSTRSVVQPSTAQTGTTSIMACSCPDGTRQISTGQCQGLCPDGQYMAGPSDTVCSPCPQGSYCVNSIITTCPAGTSSLPGASACRPCVNPGGASDIQLYTCGLKNCTRRAPVNLGQTAWMGLGKINVAVGNVNGSLPTPWQPGDTILGLVLNPASDRPFALLQRDIDLVSQGLENQQIAFQFRYRCAGMSCPDWLTVEFSQDNGQNFVQILQITDFTSSTSGWIQIATGFFVATTGTVDAPVPIQMRLSTQMTLSSCVLWLGNFEVVSLGSWQYDDISKLRLLTTDTVYVPYFRTPGAYAKPVDAVNLQLKSATFWVQIDPSAVYTGYKYVASVWAKGTGRIAIRTNGVDNASVALSSTEAQQFNLTSLSAPAVFAIETEGSVVIKGPSLLLRSPVVGCQFCLRNYWCSQAGIANCPANSVSKPGSSAQTDCWCVPGYYGKPGSLVGYTPCSVCPKNYFCTGGNNLTVCPNGTKTDDTGSTACTPCPADEFCALGRTSMCPDHSTSPIDSWDVTQCICDQGYYGVAPNCQLCEPGYFCSNGTRFACTANAVSAAGSWSQDQCYCDRGYEGVGNVPCVPCAEGSFCWTGVRTACPNHMWSPVYSSFQKNCTCDYGTYPVGAACSVCSAGTYKSTRGTDLCATCSVGTYSISSGATSSAVCTGCAPGTYSVTQGQYQCQTCSAGFYASGLASSQCATCWAGSYATLGSSVCTSCVAGTFSNVVAAVSLSTCTSCPLGSWSTANSTVCSLCGVCPYWHYPPTIFFYVQSMTPVYSDSSSNYRFAVNPADGSIFMAMGTYIYKVDLTHGTLSSPLIVQGPSATRWWFAAISTSVLGNYLYVVQNQDVYRVDLSMQAYDITYPSKLASCILEDSTQPEAVVLWIVQPTAVRQVDPLAAIDLSVYSIAGAKYACVNPADPATLYVVGSFGLKSMNKATGAFTTIKSGAAYSVCQVTSDGNFVVLSQASARTVVVYSLFDGSVTPVIANAATSGILVTGGNMVFGIDTVGVRNVTYSSADSRTCGPGQYGKSYGMTSPNTCTLCAAGNLCPGGANVTSCKPGTFGNQTGLRQQEQCSVCPVGSFCPGAVCPQGYDCAVDASGVCSGPDCTDGDNVHTCPPGSYSLATGLTKSDDCPLCVAGFYCPNPTTQLPCPNNTYAPAGSNDLGSCACAPGFRCIITKIVHAQIVLAMTAAQFNAALQQRYKAAVAAAAGLDISLVQIQGFFSITSPPTGRRLLGHRRGEWETRAVEVHTLIQRSEMITLKDLDSHLTSQGLPASRSVKVSLQSEVVQTFRH